MPLPGPTQIPPIGEQTDPDNVRVAAVVGGQLASAPARGFGLTTDEFTAVQAAAGGAYPVKTAEARSRVVNGAMQISQENGTTAIASGYPADQWTYSGVGGTAQQVASRTPNGSLYRLRVTPGTTTLCWMFQYIEGIRVADFAYGTASAKQVVLRFGMKAPAGNYGVGIRNGVTNNRSYAIPITVSAGNANIDVEYSLAIPGDTTGTWNTDNSASYAIFFHFANATTITPNTWTASGVNAPTGMRGTTVAGDVYELYDVGLYLDANATGRPPKWQMPDEAEELLACQRYYERTGQIVSTLNFLTGHWMAAKRINPAISATFDGGSGATFTVSGAVGTQTYFQNTAHSAPNTGTVTGNARM